MSTEVKRGAARRQLHRLVRRLASLIGVVPQSRDLEKEARYRWRSNREAMIPPAGAAPAPALQRCEDMSQLSSRRSTSEAGLSSSVATTERNHEPHLAYEELQTILAAAEAERRFMEAGSGPLPEELLSTQANLAIVQVPRLVKMCMMLLPPNAALTDAGGKERKES